MHYCIGDVHGCYDEMMALISKIEAQDKHAQFIFLGDFVDRGPKVWETVQWVSEKISPTGQFQSVVGNHDHLVTQWYLKWLEWYKAHPLKDRLLNHVEGDETEPKTDYDFYDLMKEHNYLNPRKIRRYVATLMALPTHKAITVEGVNGNKVTYDIVHAWYMYGYPEHSMGQHMYNMWARETGGNHENDHIIIHGHTPTVTELYAMDRDASPGMIAYRKNSINLDGGCVYQKSISRFPCMLCGICLETLEEFYPMTIEERIGERPAMLYERIYRQKESPYRLEMLERLPDKETAIKHAAAVGFGF